MSVPFDLTCWYLNQRRIIELVGNSSLSKHASGNFDSNDHLAVLRQMQVVKDAAVDWMKLANPNSLGMMLAENTLATGKIFTHYDKFGFKGLGRYEEAKAKGRNAPVPHAYSKLEAYGENLRLEIDFFPDHLTSASARHELSGQKRKFFLGLVDEVTSTCIKAIPYIFANIVENEDNDMMFGSGVWTNHLEIHIDQIDSFSAVAEVSPVRSKRQLEVLKSIPEKEIKSAIAEIIGELNVPKDWGGETSDLFSTRLVLDGRRVSTAFLLKGPAAFRPMTPAELGKNGDQISRLFDEPAEFLILQHCHEVTTAVRKQMRAFAEQMGNPRRFCIIDGYDTLRLLAAYEKHGVSFPNAAKSGAAL